MWRRWLGKLRVESWHRMDGLGKLDDEAVKLQGHRPSDVAEGGVVAKTWEVPNY